MSALHKAFQILEHLASVEDAGVAEIAKRLKLAGPTVHRLLVSLLKLGYVAKDQKSQRYSLSLRVLQLSGPLLNRLNVRKCAQPHMDWLAAKWKETVNLGIRQHNRIIYVHTIQSVEPLRIEIPLGEQLDPHCCALSKAILAHLPSEALAGFLPRGKLQRFTPMTITSHGTLAEEFDRIRRCGYSLDNEERHTGIRASGAPIRRQGGEVIAGISVAGPTIRMAGDRLAEIQTDVKREAMRISHALGCLETNASDVPCWTP